MRRCTKCYELHDEAFFNKDRSRPDGLYPYCKDCSRAACRKAYSKHHDDHVAMKRRWKAENADRKREINREWRRANPDLVRKGTRAYRARQRIATPPWVDEKLIKMVYDECPPGYHVDHIYPLCGVGFCGLHVPQNLQILTAMDNWKKGNRTPDAGGGYV